MILTCLDCFDKGEKKEVCHAIGGTSLFSLSLNL